MYTLYNAVKAHRGSRGIALPRLHLDARWSWLVDARRCRGTAKKGPRGPLYRRLGGPNGKTEIKCNEGLGRMFGDAP
jgi:hypothetical protein